MSRRSTSLDLASDPVSPLYTRRRAGNVCCPPVEGMVWNRCAISHGPPTSEVVLERTIRELEPGITMVIAEVAAPDPDVLDKATSGSMRSPPGGIAMPGTGFDDGGAAAGEPRATADAAIEPFRCGASATRGDRPRRAVPREWALQLHDPERRSWSPAGRCSDDDQALNATGALVAPAAKRRRAVETLGGRVRGPGLSLLPDARRARPVPRARTPRASGRWRPRRGSRGDLPAAPIRRAGGLRSGRPRQRHGRAATSRGAAAR